MDKKQSNKKGLQKLEGKKRKKVKKKKIDTEEMKGIVGGKNHYGTAYSTYNPSTAQT
jgi:hypothetical protein